MIFILHTAGDSNTITIGDAVTIGDNTMIHCDGAPRPSPVTIGNRVIIGNGATVHGAILEDECVVGDRATVLDLAVIRKHGVLAPGSLLAGGKEVKTGELWAGVPAKFQRTLSLAEIESIADMAAEGVEIAAIHTKDDKLNYLDLYNERDEYYQIVNRAEYYHTRMTPEELEKMSGDVEGHTFPGRVLNSTVSARENKESRPYMD
jgi:carbonic anhydrase/acetyltransferase-like protein (isoleucine patch superfamily)